MPTVGPPRAQDSKSARERKFYESLSRNSIRPGTIMMWPAVTPPEGFISLDGSAYSRQTYSQVFAVVGTDFGDGDGSTTFNVPDWNTYAPTGGIYIMRV